MNEREFPNMGSAVTIVDILGLEINKLKEENAELKGELEFLEQRKPHWEKGYTSDSVAAQCSTSALTQLWDLLGVENQAEAIQELKQLKATTEK